MTTLKDNTITINPDQIIAGNGTGVPYYMAYPYKSKLYAIRFKTANRPVVGRYEAEQVTIINGYTGHVKSLYVEVPNA